LGKRNDATSSEEELIALRRDVAALQRTVARLSEIVAEKADGAELTSAVVASQLRDEARTPEFVTIDEDERPSEEPAEPTYADSPYRGLVPDRPGEIRCHRCRKRLEADDPELRLENEAGRVCIACFQGSTG
jgi:hypothetical protein